MRNLLGIQNTANMLTAYPAPLLAGSRASSSLSMVAGCFSIRYLLEKLQTTLKSTSEQCTRRHVFLYQSQERWGRVVQSCSCC
ncbi:unnamed protein product [Urochloa humidicola]